MTRTLLIIAALSLLAVAVYAAIRVHEAGKGCDLFCYQRAHFSLWQVKKHGPYPSGKPAVWFVSGDGRDGYMHCLASHEKLDVALLQAALGGELSMTPWW